jgi:iron complex transport system permease protein
LVTDQPRDCGTDTGRESAGARTALLQPYHRRTTQRLLILLGLGVACLGCMLAELMIGAGTLSLHDVLQGLFTPSKVDPSVRVILWQLRLPVVCTAALAGAGLAIAGSLMQSALRNPLAEPFTLGISSAAGFGAALAILFQPVIGAALSWLPADLTISASAFCFSLVTILGIGLLAQQRRMGTDTVLLLGIAMHFTFSSMLGFTQYLADADQLQSLVFWLLGSVQRTDWTKVSIDAALLALILPILLLRGWMLTAVRSFGSHAAVLGIRVERARFYMLLAAALLAGSVTATVGIIGFVGLVAPQMARLLVGEDQRFAICAAAACGILVMTTAAIASEILIPGAVLPIGMLTALLGVPFFLAQILSRRGTHAEG